MSFIYPECPSCGQKSEDGVGLQQMPEFDYECPHCGTTRRGTFVQEPHPHVEWFSDPDETGLRSGKGPAWFSKLFGLHVIAVLVCPKSKT